MLKRILSHGKKAAALMFVAASSLVWVCGLVVVPQAIDFLRENGLAWAATPGVIWSAFVITVQASVVAWIIKQPEQPVNENKWLDSILETVKGGTMREYRLVELLVDVHNFENAMHEHLGKPSNTEYTLSVLEVFYPARILELLGEKLQQKYVSVLKDTKERSKSTYIIAATVIPIMEDAIFTAMDEERKDRTILGTHFPATGAAAKILPSVPK